MLCLSESARYRINIRGEEQKYNPTTGRPMGKLRGLYAQFQPGSGLQPWAQQMALERFEFKGLPMDLDPLSTVGWWDSELAAREEGWTDEDQREVEAFMEERNGDGYFIVERQKLKAPWPAYDKLTAQGARTVEMIAERIAKKVTEDEYDPADVIAYERENLNRPAVIAALERLTAEEVSEPETVVAA